MTFFCFVRISICIRAWMIPARIGGVKRKYIVNNKVADNHYRSTNVSLSVSIPYLECKIVKFEVSL